MKRLHKDWMFAVIICAFIIISMAGSLERTPFEVDKSFERVCSSYWLAQKKLAESRTADNPLTTSESCTCITNAMRMNGASKDEYGVLIQWLSTTRNYDLDKYFEIAKYEGDSVFDKSLEQCADGTLETAMQ